MIRNTYYIFIKRDGFFDRLIKAIYFNLKFMPNTFKKIYYGFLISKKISFSMLNDITLDYRLLIDTDTKFPHPIGIVIGAGVKVGNNCKIYQHVTIGTKDGYPPYPIIGDNVVVYAGASVIGDVKIGNNVIIGANSLVLSDIPDGVVIAGCPAKIIRKNNMDNCAKVFD